LDRECGNDSVLSKCLDDRGVDAEFGECLGL